MDIQFVYILALGFIYFALIFMKRLGKGLIGVNVIIQINKRTGRETTVANLFVLWSTLLYTK